ncbi:putative Tartarate transporter [Microstroma glucosiphilum]|uniref:Putative Tartarate transporter n=1 Tax=Pseudomicrostroma glucosiphilum TaxID=1684307 RepID=A0A316U3K7_9BASI|nr:putative Tartarate transporter [Pseudomicrostroma glucosiphilum]PWN19886.1 putative Tartarate transporter [Pseudomicrostroma glucosiphilum]
MAAVTPILVTDDPDIVQQPIVDRKMADEVGPEDVNLVRSGRLKIDLLVLSCIILMFIFLQFDRTSLGQALTDNFRKIAGVSTSDINTGQTLFTLAFVLFEIPANVAIKRFGVHRWLPALMFAWGTVTWCQMFITSKSAFYATRFILAACEAGFIPGAAFYLGQFYSRKEMAFRYALLWSANGIAGAIAGVLALGLLSLSGTGGLFGWQWLFLIEGVLTCAIAVFAALHLPQSPHGATSHRVFGRSFAILSEAEAEALSSRAVRDDPTKASQSSRKVALRDFDILLDWRFYGHAVSAFLSSIMFTPINTYGPSIIKSLGFAGYTANGLSSVGSVLSLITSLSLAWNSDRTRERGLHIMTGFLISAVGLLWLAAPPNGVAKGILYAGIVVTQGGMGSVQGINAAWLSEHIQERQRPVALASYVMSIQLASFVGSNIFTAAEAPRYSKALFICAGCVLGAVLVAGIWKVLYAILAKKDAAATPAASESSHEEDKSSTF